YLQTLWPCSFALTDIKVQRPSKGSIPVDITVLIKKAPLAAPGGQVSVMAPQPPGSPGAAPPLQAAAQPMPSPKTQAMIPFLALTSGAGSRSSFDRQRSKQVLQFL
ncbi:unnamed protein product, partial [Symbiodinium sp. CCMP2456]